MSCSVKLYFQNVNYVIHAEHVGIYIYVRYTSCRLINRNIHHILNYCNLNVKLLEKETIHNLLMDNYYY